MGGIVGKCAFNGIDSHRLGEHINVDEAIAEGGTPR